MPQILAWKSCGVAGFMLSSLAIQRKQNMNVICGIRPGVSTALRIVRIERN